MNKTIKINNSLNPGAFPLKNKYNEFDLIMMLANRVLQIQNTNNKVSGSHRISWEGCYYDDLAIELQFTRIETATEIVINLNQIAYVEDIKPF
jgi:hypothetical protein